MLRIDFWRKKAEEITVSEPAKSSVNQIDIPLTNSENDKFGYEPFAEHANHVLESLPGIDGCVAAVNAPWGMGKTTFLNFLKNRFENEKAGPKSGKRRVIYFNPWLSSSRSEMIGLFFGQLAATFKNNGMDEALNLISDLCFVLKESELSFAGFKPFGVIDAAINIERERNQDLYVIKTKLVNCLRRENFRFLVVIDDIDRLSAEETKQLFGVVKVLGDLPKITYMLAFDRQVVAAILREHDSIDSGEEYLDKIVQVNLQLPRPSKRMLGRLFLDVLRDSLEGLVGDRSPYSFASLREDDRFKRFLNEFILPMMHTPRDAKRLVTCLYLSLLKRVPDVAPSDYIMLECLRLFSSATFELIQTNQACLTDSSHPDFGLCLEKVTELPEADRKILVAMFPGLGAKLKSRKNDGDVVQQAKPHDGVFVSDPNVLENYFMHLVEEPPITRVAYYQTLEVLQEKPFSEFEQRMLDLSKSETFRGGTRAAAFFDGLMVRNQDLSETHKLDLIRLLLRTGDELWTTKPEDAELDSLLDSESRNNTSVDFSLVHWLLADLNDDKLKILKDDGEIARCNSPSILSAFFLNLLNLDLPESRQLFRSALIESSKNIKGECKFGKLLSNQWKSLVGDSDWTARTTFDKTVIFSIVELFKAMLTEQEQHRVFSEMQTESNLQKWIRKQWDDFSGGEKSAIEMIKRN